MFFLKCALALMVLGLYVTPSTVRAGGDGWVGSGGEVFRLARNPWFLDKNTKTVNYCIAIDAATVSAKPDEIRASLQAALAYWKEELRYTLPVQGFVGLGSQQFVETSDCSQVDIQFKFGYGTLDQDEIDFLNREGGKTNGFKSYVGVSIRKTYDEDKMKGTGVVYIASDIGANAYNNPGHLINRAWQNQKLIQYALMHELGHVFGFPHTGTSLMSEVFLDHLLHVKFSTMYINDPVRSFLNPPRNFEVCNIYGTFNSTFFQVSNDVKCLRFEAQGASLATWKVYSKMKMDDPKPVEIGLVDVVAQTKKFQGARPAVIVHLPDKQSLFTMKDYFVNSFMLGPVFADYGYTGYFTTTKSAKPYQLYIDLKPENITFVGTVGTQNIPVMVYSPPSLMEMLLPFQLP